MSPTLKETINSTEENFGVLVEFCIFEFVHDAMVLESVPKLLTDSNVLVRGSVGHLYPYPHLPKLLQKGTCHNLRNLPVL